MRCLAIGSVPAVILGAVLLSGCGGSNVVIKGADGGTHDGGAGGGGGGGAGGGGGSALDAGDGCPEEAKTVYVVDTDGTFSSFDPKLKQFHDIGTLSCPAQSGANPFSMAVDRTATALVLYDSGELFRVNTTSLACAPTAFDSGAGHGFSKFGMGFSTDQAGGTTDTLFISGGANVGTTSSMARLDLATFTPTPFGTVDGWPELTGTGDAKLWGFMPSASGSIPRVVQLSKTDASTLRTFSAPSLAGVPLGWAFAFWGGRFWIFLKRSGEPSTVVYVMDASTGALSTALSDTGARNIVGAGVSTCAPIN